jgi:hypothetical protein
MAAMNTGRKSLSALKMALVGLAILAAPGLGSCRNPASSSSVSTTGSLVVSISASSASASRIAGTILPGFAALIDSVSVTLSATGKTPQTQSASSWPASFSFPNLASDSWTISATVYHSGTAIGSGGGSVTIGTETSQSVAVPITFSGFSSTDPDGTLSIAITWPSATGIDYLSWHVDSDPPTTASGLSGSYTAVKSLSPGRHSLFLSFKKDGASGSPAGSFVEAVDIYSGLTSSSWIGSSGTSQGAMELLAGNFLDTDSSLGNLVIRDGSSSGQVIDIGFSSSTSPYLTNKTPVSSTIVFAPSESQSGQYITYTWNSGSPTPIASDNYTSPLVFSSSVSDVLTINVLAPNRAGSTTYTITWYGAAGISISTPTISYQSIGLPSTASIIQGQAFAAETSNAALDAVTSGWSWYLDGTQVLGETSQRFTLSPIDTLSKLGTYQIAAALTYNGVSYSGRVALTVSRRVALSYPALSTAALVSALPATSDSYDLCCCGSSLYVIDTTVPQVFKYDLSTKTLSVFAGDGTVGNTDGIGTNARFGSLMSIATDGTNLFLGDDGSSNPSIAASIRKICIATGAVTTLVSGAFTHPDGLWTNGETLYVCDRATNKLSTVNLKTKAVATFAGSGTAARVDGTGTGASFNSPFRICGDGTNLYVTEYGSGAVRKIIANSAVVSTLATGYVGPAGILFDGTDLYLCNADGTDHPIARLTLAGASTNILTGLNFPKGITTDGSKLYVADTGNDRIVEVVK